MAAAFVAGIAAARADEPIKIKDSAWSAYQQYLEVINAHRQGVFAIAVDGGGGASWICKKSRCSNTSNTPTRRSAVVRINPGYECVVFAVGNEPQIPYEAPAKRNEEIGLKRRPHL
jgi:hypothetical protein